MSSNLPSSLPPILPDEEALANGADLGAHFSSNPPDCPVVRLAGLTLAEAHLEHWPTTASKAASRTRQRRDAPHED